MKHLGTLSVVAVALVAGGFLIAQTTTPPQGQGRGRAALRAAAGANVLARINWVLNLTDAQKTQAKQIFSNAQQQGATIRQQMQQDRKSLLAAIKSGSTANIDTLSNTIAGEQGQLLGIRAKAVAQFYQILTPDQQTKLGNGIGALLNGGPGRGGRGPNAGQPNGGQ